MNNSEYQSDDFERRRYKPAFRVVESGEAAGRALPFSAEAEGHVLACCLLDGASSIERCLREKLTPDAFHGPAHRAVFEVISDMHQKAQPVAIDTVVEELATRKLLEGIGGVNFLMDLTREIPTTAHLGFFISKVREQWVLRKMILLGTDLVEKAHDFTGGLEDFVSRHTLRMQRWAGFVTRQGKATQKEEAEKARDDLHSILAGKVDHSRRLTCGLPWLDKNFLPLDVKCEDWLIIVGAAPSQGKSTLMRFMAKENLKAEKRGAVFLLETGRTRWIWAMAAAISKVEFRQLLDKPLSGFPQHVADFKAAVDLVTSWCGERLFVFDDLVYIEDIERQVRETDRALREKDLAAGIAPEKARGLDFVIIDYLQLMATREKIRVREEIVSHMVRTCQRLFKQLDICGLVASQLNRKARDEDRRPKLSDLRESGAIEQDAVRVWLLHTPPNDSAGIPQTGERSIDEIEVIQAKSRNGPRDIICDLLFYKKQARYEEGARKGDVRPGAPKPAAGYKREGAK